MLTPLTPPVPIEKLLGRISSQFSESPIPLPGQLYDVPNLSADLAKKMLPHSFADWAVDTSERLCVPIESLAVLGMSALGGIIGRQIAIAPKCQDDWFEFAKRWAAIVAAPSEKKSAILSEALRPLGALEELARRKYLEGEAASSASKTSLKAQMDVVRENMITAARSDDTSCLSNYEQKFAELETKLKADQHSERRYRTSDATIEKIGELLIKNPNGLLVVRDELYGWICGLGRQGREQDRTFYLEAWAGKNNFLVDRIGRPSINIPALSLTVLGTIQPDRLKGLVSEATKGKNGGDGLLQRFQLLVQPDRMEYLGVVDRKPNQKFREQYAFLFKSLSELNPSLFGASQFIDCESGKISVVRFSKEAQQIFYSWLDAHERKLRSGATEENAALEAHLGKYSGLMPGLSLLFHLVEVVEGTWAGTEGISSLAASRAVDWCQFLEAHAKRVYAQSDHPEFRSAHNLLKKIHTGKVIDGMTVREAYRPQWSYLKTSGEMDKATQVLQKFGWIKLENITTGGAPSQTIRLHPSLIKI